MPADPDVLQSDNGGELPRRRPSGDLTRFVTRLRSEPPMVERDVLLLGDLAGAPNSDEEYRRQIGRRLRLARVGRDMSQDDVAQCASTTRNFVSAIERGAQSLDAWRLRKVAAALGVSAGWLLGLPDAPGPQ